MSVIVIETERMRVEIDPSCGGRIDSIIQRENNISWLVPPASGKPAGWFTALLSEDAEAVHGERNTLETFALTEPLQVDRISPVSVTLLGVLERPKLSIRKTVELELSGSVKLTETVSNLNRNPVSLFWGHFLCLALTATQRERSALIGDATGYFVDGETPVVRRKFPRSAEGDDLSGLAVKDSAVDWIYVSDFDDAEIRLQDEAHRVYCRLQFERQYMPYLWVAKRAEQTFMLAAPSVLLAPCSGMQQALQEGHGLLRLAPQAQQTITTILSCV